MIVSFIRKIDIGRHTLIKTIKGHAIYHTNIRTQRKITKLDFGQCCRRFSAGVYYFEMMGYIAKGDLNIRTHRDITGKMCLGWGKAWKGLCSS